MTNPDPTWLRRHSKLASYTIGAAILVGGAMFVAWAIRDVRLAAQRTSDF